MGREIGCPRSSYARVVHSWEYSSLYEAVITGKALACRLKDIGLIKQVIWFWIKWMAAVSAFETMFDRQLSS